MTDDEFWDEPPEDVSIDSITALRYVVEMSYLVDIRELSPSERHRLKDIRREANYLRDSLEWRRRNYDRMDGPDE